jgi:hypothetical protein
MSEFMKNKVNFALALLGTLFVLFTFENKLNDVTEYTDFPLWNVPGLSDGVCLQFKLTYALFVGGTLLALAVYLYALAIVTEKSAGWLERLGNLAYALALLSLPLYAILIVSHWLSVHLGWDKFHYAGPIGLGVAVALWIIASLLLRRRLGRQDSRAQMRQLAHLEVEHVRKARDMHAHHHYDMAVIEAWKALESRLHRLLLHRGERRHLTMPQMIERALRLKIITPDLQQSVEQLRQHWNTAIGTVPLTKENAEIALAAARKLMSSLPIEEHSPQEVASKRV